jgi:hypothetical protein
VGLDIFVGLLGHLLGQPLVMDHPPTLQRPPGNTDTCIEGTE